MQLAREHSMALRLNTWTHYTLRANDFMRWEILPDDQIVYANPTTWPTTPDLMPALKQLGEWSLLQVVQAAIAAIQERGSDNGEASVQTNGHDILP